VRAAPTPHSPQKALWLDFRNDLRVCFGEHGLVRTGRLGLGDYLRSIAHANVFARWSLSDPLPVWRDFSTRVRGALGRALRSR
jgi:hypothetical protein